MTMVVIDYFALTGKIVEYDEPLKLMSMEGSLFGQLVKEYWSHSASGSVYLEN